MVVLNEIEWVKKAIEEQELGKKPYETLLRVAKYYYYEGLKKTAVRKELDKFVLSCDPGTSLPKWSDLLDLVTSKSSKMKIINIDHIDITASEINTISGITSKMAQRLAFTLLCLSKYWDFSIGSDHWVNTEDGEIMKMANIKTSIKKQCELFRILYEAGLIQYSKKVNNTNVRVLFQNNDDEVVLQISDFRNLGWQYLNYLGGGFYVCQNCGITTKIPKDKTTGPNFKYCPDCASKIAIQQRVNSVMRYRKLEKDLIKAKSS